VGLVVVSRGRVLALVAVAVLPPACMSMDDWPEQAFFACEDEGAGEIDWVRLAGGEYQMGSEDGDSNERPVHPVQVAAFELARTEVTVAQYRACVEAGTCTTEGLTAHGSCNWGKPGRGCHPVNCLDWDQARAFAAWVDGRLPSEAEWEYAARSGGRDQAYPWGDEAATCERAVMSDGGNGCGEGRTWDVCSKPEGNSEQGLCDLAGNVWEWVEDVYQSSYDGAPADAKAWVESGGSRVIRGGSWYGGAGGLRAARRSGGDPQLRHDYLGLRPARSSP